MDCRYDGVCFRRFPTIAMILMQISFAAFTEPFPESVTENQFLKELYTFGNYPKRNLENFHPETYFVLKVVMSVNSP